MEAIQNKLDEIKSQELIAKANLDNANKALNDKCALENKHFSQLRYTIEYREYSRCMSEVESLRKKKRKIIL